MDCRRETMGRHPQYARDDMKRTTILLADDHTMFSAGLQKLLEPEFEVIGCVQDGRALIKTAVEMKPDVILVDAGMHLLNGLEAGRELKKLSRCRTLLPATANDSDLRECLKSATALGIQALGLGLSELAVKTVETVGRSCSAMLKQGGVAKLVDNCRTI